MKTINISAATIAALCVAFTVSGAGQDRIPEAQREKAAVDTKTPTLTGCVARGTAADTYTLTSNAKATETAAKDEMQPRLISLASTTVDLSAHVGHQVAVTGTYADAAKPTGTSGTAAATPATPAAAPVPGTPMPPTASGAAETMPRAFTVSSLKMVAPSCATGA